MPLYCGILYVVLLGQPGHVYREFKKAFAKTWMISKLSSKSLNGTVWIEWHSVDFLRHHLCVDSGPVG